MQEIDNKLNNILKEVKNFCDLQIKTVSEKYENIIKKIKNECEELNFELSKKNYAQNELMLLKDTYEKKYNESNKSIDYLKSMIEDKEEIIKTQNNAFKVYENRIYDSEMKMAENIVNLKVKEDEYDSLFLLIETIISKNKKGFEREVNKLPQENQKILNNYIKQYKFFK